MIRPVAQPDERQDFETASEEESPRAISLFFGRDWGMAFFLAFLVITTIVVPAVTLSEWGRLTLDLVFVVTIISGAFVTIQRNLAKALVTVLAVSGFAVALVAERSFGPLGLVLDSALKLVCLAILVLMTLQRTLRPGPVTVFRVFGGIAGYLLIGMTWTYAYQLCEQKMPDAIHFEEPASRGGPRQANELMYFSFVTLTTVGYGDVRPVHPAVRSLATAEALVGQLYLAILISSLVGMAIQRKPAGDS